MTDKHLEHTIIRNSNEYFYLLISKKQPMQLHRLFFSKSCTRFSERVCNNLERVYVG